MKIARNTVKHMACLAPSVVWSLLLALMPASGVQAFQRNDNMNATTASEGSEATSSALTDRVIVKYRDASSSSAPSSSSLSKAQGAGADQGVSVTHQRRMSMGTDVLKLSKPLSEARIRSMAAAMKKADSTVEYVEADQVMRAQASATDPLYSQQWALFDSTAGINAPTAWNSSTGSGVVVAVVDTGVRPHADLAANLLSGYDFISDTVISNDGDGRDGSAYDPGDAVAAGYCETGSSASDSSWHGTHVAGIIAAVANNGTGIAGVAYGAKILPVRVLGRCGGYMSDIADGIVWAAGGTVSGVPTNSTPAKVINLSLGGSGSCSTTMQSAITKARAAGAVVVVAAGNSKSDASAFTPASCSGVITVAANGMTGGRASYSNYGSIVSVMAPGGDTGGGILSTLNSGTSSPSADSYASYIGTSMATPHVSGVAALMLAKNSALTTDQVSSILKSSARAFPVSCSGCGSGIVDASAAVAAAASATTVVVSSGSIAEVESNDTMTTAQAITTLPTTVAGTVASATDSDLYKVTVNGGVTLTSALTPNSSSDYDLYVYNSQGRLVATVGSAGVGQTDTVAVRNSGTVSAIAYVRVVYARGLTGSSATYSLKLSGS